MNDGAPVTLQVARPGEPLRAGERLEGGVPGYPTSRSGARSASASCWDPPLAEEDPDNNTWDGSWNRTSRTYLEVSSVETDGRTDTWWW